MKYLGIDIGGTKTAAGLFGADKKLIAEEEIPTAVANGAEGIVHNTAETVMKLLTQYGVEKREIPYIGIGCPGSVDGKKGIVKYANNLNFNEVPLAEMLEKELGIPVMLENDANCAGLGEYLALPDYDTVESFFIVTLGTGVGTAFVYKGKLFTGFNGAAPEMGHCILDVNGPMCDCGKQGCWEMYCAGHSLVRNARKAAEENPDSLMLEMAAGNIGAIDGRIPFEAWRKGDRTAARVVEDYIKYYKAGIGNVINAFQPQVLTIGGGISRQGELFLEAAREAIGEYSYCKTVDKPEVRKSVLGVKAGMYGAAMLGI